MSTLRPRTDRPARRAHRAAVVALLALATVAGSGVADAATTTKLDFNIAVNPGAEAATGGSGEVVPIPLWSKTSTMTAVAYGASGFPTTTYAATFSGGNDLFYCGRDTAGSLARQRIKIVGRDALIDAGALTLQTAVRIGTTADDGDSGKMLVRFLSATGATLGTLSTTAATNTGGLMPRILTNAPVPAGTRALRVVLQGTAAAGPDCDVVFDNVSIRLHKGS